jgi:hypothetical protein
LGVDEDEWSQIERDTHRGEADAVIDNMAMKTVKWPKGRGEDVSEKR